jgi:hypothetical protein
MVTSDWLWNSWGGPAVFIARQAEFLRREGIEVDLFPFRGSRHPANYLAAWKEVRRRVRSGSYDLVHAQFGQSARHPQLLGLRHAAAGRLLAVAQRRVEDQHSFGLRVRHKGHLVRGCVRWGRESV